ncbi:hypothetical protein RUM44_000627 [Polyplax serrata]|uniref:BTB domain-containing protein n=1 Tax=Polyplax serrata TaxID=468196 RepID=A0ABR1B859_POLSC
MALQIQLSICLKNSRSKEKSIVSSFVKEKEDAEEVEHFVNDDIKIERILKPRVTIDSKSKSSSPIRMNISERVNMSLQIKPQVAAQQYCLRWKYHHSNLQVMFIQLLQRESFCDVTLACEGKMLRAHKIFHVRIASVFYSLLSTLSHLHFVVIREGSF